MSNYPDSDSISVWSSCMLRREAANTNLIISDFTRSTINEVSMLIGLTQKGFSLISAVNEAGMLALTETVYSENSRGNLYDNLKECTGF